MRKIGSIVAGTASKDAAIVGAQFKVGKYIKVAPNVRMQLPAAFGGVFTGVLLAISRVIGETAPLMFTALGCSFIRCSPTPPTSAPAPTSRERWDDGWTH